MATQKKKLMDEPLALDQLSRRRGRTMADESRRNCVLVATDRATRYVYIDVKNHKTAAAAKSFLQALSRAAPFKIRTILTDNGKEFANRLFGQRAKYASDAHEVDELYAVLGIEHRLTKQKSPQTNGMVERFNGRIEKILRSHHYHSAADLEAALHRYVWLYTTNTCRRKP
jgi:transposase InsO family protein